jgi:hypothetical protein
VNGGFHRAGKRLAQLIARHQQTLAMLGAGGVKGRLLWIWPIIGEPVLDPASLLLGNETLLERFQLVSGGL